MMHLGSPFLSRVWPVLVCLVLVNNSNKKNNKNNNKHGVCLEFGLQNDVTVQVFLAWWGEGGSILLFSLGVVLIRLV